jgi:uncharacterized RDD family membrane protein YckC
VGITKAKTLNRVIAKSIDFIIIGALLEAIPRIGYFAGLAYLLIGDGLFDGRSIGKRLMGLRVVLYETGEICTLKASVIRNFTFVAGYILMRIPLIGFIFPLVVLFFEGMLLIGNEKGMRLGDEIAKTQVIEENRG